MNLTLLLIIVGLLIVLTAVLAGPINGWRYDVSKANSINFNRSRIDHTFVILPGLEIARIRTDMPLSDHRSDVLLLSLRAFLWKWSLIWAHIKYRPIAESTYWKTHPEEWAKFQAEQAEAEAALEAAKARHYQKAVNRIAQSVMAKIGK